MTSNENAAAVAGSAPDLPAALCRAFVQATALLVCVVDRDGRILLANPALQDFTGKSADELLGRRFWDVYVDPEHVNLSQDALARSIERGRVAPQEGNWLGGGGERRRVAMHLDVLADGEDRPPYAVACVGLDVTEQRLREYQLHQRAHSDLLTGVANRSGLFDAMNRHLDPETGDGCGVLFCDLDQFKTVNDRHGHAVGDRLLVEVAARLQEVADGDDLVARLGGDEFVVLCAHADEQRLTALAQAVVGRVRAPFPGPAGPLSVGVSIGIATGQPGDLADDLIARADRDMYGVKTHQRRRRTHRDRPRTDRY